MSVALFGGWRLPSCGDRCIARSHDPRTHENYGYVLALVKPPLRVVQTGPLTIDLARHEVRVHGEVVPVVCPAHQSGTNTQRRWRMLESLAVRVGDTVTYDTLSHEVFGYPLDRFSAASINMVRHRLRGVLGDARSLVVTVPGIGMRLEQELPL